MRAVKPGWTTSVNHMLCLPVGVSKLWGHGWGDLSLPNFGVPMRIEKKASQWGPDVWGLFSSSGLLPLHISNHCDYYESKIQFQFMTRVIICRVAQHWVIQSLCKLCFFCKKRFKVDGWTSYPKHSISQHITSSWGQHTCTICKGSYSLITHAL